MNHRTHLKGYQSTQIGQLTNVIEKSLKENHRIFKQIVLLDESFTHRFYKPICQTGIENQFIKPLLLKQINQLMEEKDFLLKKKEQANFKKQNAQPGETEEVGEQQLKTQNSYIALREAWTKFSNKGVDCTEHIDNLNKIVGMVRKSISQITNIQKDQNNQLNALSGVLAHESIDYSKIMKVSEIRQQKLEQLMMKNEDLESRVHQLDSVIISKNTKIRKLESELQLAGIQIKKSLQMFNSNIGKIKGLQLTKNQLERKMDQFKVLKSEELKNIKIYEAINGQYTIKLECIDVLNGLPWVRTKRTLVEVLLFFGSDTTTNLGSVSARGIPVKQNNEENTDLGSLSDLVPTLDLSKTSRSTALGNTERFTPKINKFIPLRTSRHEFQKSNVAKISSNQQRQSHGQSNKKFSRKGEYAPLTSGRNLVGRDEIGIDSELKQSINKKLQLIEQK